jgi:hypothetical protein
VTRRLTVTWPDPAPFAGRAGRPIRILAASDEPDPVLGHETNRQALGAIDLIVTCGDLESDWVSFLGDMFHAPIVRILGNHDVRSDEPAVAVPEPLLAGVESRLAVPIVGLSWPGRPPRRASLLAWWQVLRIVVGRIGRAPVLVASHIAPAGLGDAPDPYHRGLRSYRWLLHRLRPPLWLHGHTTLASIVAWRVTEGRTQVVNVTGSLLVELLPPGTTN